LDQKFLARCALAENDIEILQNLKTIRSRPHQTVLSRLLARSIYLPCTILILSKKKSENLSAEIAKANQIMKQKKKSRKKE